MKNTILYHAIEQGDILAVQKFIHQGGDIHERHDEPLRSACRFKQFSIIQLLVENHADINAVDIIKDTPLIELCKIGWHDNVSEMIFYLLEKNADISISHHRAFFYACARCDFTVVEKMIALNADVNCIFEEGTLVKYNPLLIAGITERLDIVELLLQHGAHLNYIENSILEKNDSKRAIEFIEKTQYYQNFKENLPINSHQSSLRKI